MHIKIKLLKEIEVYATSKNILSSQLGSQI